MIFHITTSHDWADAQASGRYEADSLPTEGFIHCSTAGQVAPVANVAFRGRRDLVVLHIDDSLLAVPVKYENLDGGDELFPHVYGAVPSSAVSAVTALEARTDGTFEFRAD